MKIRKGYSVIQSTNAWLIDREAYNQHKENGYKTSESPRIRSIKITYKRIFFL